jgi:predicted nucleotidyltransferase
MNESHINVDLKKDQVVISFTEELKNQIPKYLKNVILYGSRARGDNKKNSDYDFVVLLNKKNEEISEIVYDIGYGILDKYEKLASCLIWNEEEWKIQQKFPIGKNILKDGIWLL